MQARFSSLGSAVTVLPAIGRVAWGSRRWVGGAYYSLAAMHCLEGTVWQRVTLCASCAVAPVCARLRMLHEWRHTYEPCSELLYWAACHGMPVQLLTGVRRVVRVFSAACVGTRSLVRLLPSATSSCFSVNTYVTLPHCSSIQRDALVPLSAPPQPAICLVALFPAPQHTHQHW